MSWHQLDCFGVISHRFECTYLCSYNGFKYIDTIWFSVKSKWLEHGNNISAEKKEKIRVFCSLGNKAVMSLDLDRCSKSQLSTPAWRTNPILRTKILVAIKILDRSQPSSTRLAPLSPTKTSRVSLKSKRRWWLGP